MWLKKFDTFKIKKGCLKSGQQISFFWAAKNAKMIFIKKSKILVF
jgi:hypothetical protein